MGRRKSAVVRKVVADEEEDDTESSSVRSVKNGHRHGDNSTEDSSQPEDVICELPEGTVIVEPEPVQEEKTAIFRGPEFMKSRKLTGGDASASVTCTACAKQINPFNPGAARRHPVLQVLICKKCYKYYKSGKIAQDSNGIDEQCRWCGEGGNLLCCDFCSNAFCKGCIKRNLGRAELSRITEAGEDDEWKCYVCSPLPLTAHIEDCNHIFERIEKEKKKEEIAERNRTEREKGKVKQEAKQPKDKSVLPRHDQLYEEFLRSVCVNIRNVPQVIDKFLTATKNLNLLLVTLKSNLHAAKVASRNSFDDTPPIEDDDDDKVDSGTNIEGMERIIRDRCVQTLTQGLKTFTKSVINTVEIEKRNRATEQNVKSSTKSVTSPRGSSRSSDKKEAMTHRFQGLKDAIAKRSPRMEVISLSDSSSDEEDRGKARRKLSYDAAKRDTKVGKSPTKTLQKSASKTKSKRKIYKDSESSMDVDQSDSDFGKSKHSRSSKSHGKQKKSKSSDDSDQDDDDDDDDDSKHSSKRSESKTRKSGSHKSDKHEKVQDESDVKSVKDTKKAKTTAKKESPNNKEDKDVSDEKSKKTDEKSECDPVKKADKEDMPLKDKSLKDNESSDAGKSKQKSSIKGSESAEMVKSDSLELIELDDEEEVSTSAVNCENDDGDVKKTPDSDQTEEVSTSVVIEEGDVENVNEISSSQVDEDNIASIEEKTPKKRMTRSGDSGTLLSPNTQNMMAQLDLLKEMAEDSDNCDAGGDDSDKKSSDDDDDSDFSDDSVKKKRKKKAVQANKGSSTKKSDKKVDKVSSSTQKSGSKKKSKDNSDSEDIEGENRGTKGKRKSSSSKKKEGRKGEISEDDNDTEDRQTKGKKSKSAKTNAKSKKSRKSTDDDDDDSDISDLELKSSKQKLRKSSKSRGKKESEDGDGDDSSKDSKKEKRKSKSAKSSVKKKKDSDSDDDISDIESDWKYKPSKEKPKRSSKSPEQNESEDEDGDEDGDDDVEVDSSKKRKKEKSETKLMKSSEKKKKKDTESDNDDDNNDDIDDESQTEGKDDDEEMDEKAKKKAKKGSDSKMETEDKKSKKAAKSEGNSKKKRSGKDDDSSSSSNDNADDMDDEAEFDDDSDHEISFKKNENKKKNKKDENSPEMENKNALKSLKAELGEGDSSDNSDSDDSSDSEPTPKAKRKGGSKRKQEKASAEENGESASDSGKNKKKGKRGLKKEFDDSDSDFVSVPCKKSKHRQRKKLLDAKISDSDSDVQPTKRGKVGKGRKKGIQENGKGGKKRKRGSGSDDSSDDGSIFHDSDVSVDSAEEKRERARSYRDRKKKRRRIQMADDSDDESVKSAKSGSDKSGDDDDDDHTPGKRKKIRRILTKKKLGDETIAAAKAEEDRRKRVAERQKKYNVVQHEDVTSPVKCPMTTKLVLESDPDTDKPLIEVNKKLVRKLKPHQVEAVQFMWECCCETLARLKKDEGAGCILAHCMGLGKTLSVIAFVHTMLKRRKLTKMRTCLVVCPLNTVLNWQTEWDMWFDEDDKLDVYDLNMVKVNTSRADMLEDWQETGGILIMGYEMYRNLTLSNSRIKSKKLKAIFEKTLVNPGPNLVVCDEGHVLKNDSSALSRAMSRINTLRRIVLTGTPLQNNLIEYHCMVDFVKPKLLGTRKEFSNRFVNPITNGQCADSTPFDVKIMKRRAHILHDLLAGCVQRRDYSALTKFLPPKFEYVISVRLSQTQVDLYRGYLERRGVMVHDSGELVTKGAKLFSDYQYLMRIWTHPWVLKLDEIRVQNRPTWDDSDEMDSFIDDENSTSDDSLIRDSSSSDSDNDIVNISSDSDGDGNRKRKTRTDKKTKSGSGDEQGDTKNEVVKEWKTRSRGGGPVEIGESSRTDDLPNDQVTSEWWKEFVKEEDKFRPDLGGKLVLLFEILRMCEEIGDKVLVFSQSLLSLDLIEDFLEYMDAKHQEAMSKQMEEEKEKKEEEAKKNEVKKDENKDEVKNGEKDENKDEEKDENKDEEKDENKDGEKSEEKEESKEGEKNDEISVEKVAEDVEKFLTFGVSWTRGEDYFRFDGSTSPILRKQYADHFNDPENYRARLFLISTKAGSLGINLVAANRVIVFDASWNPSHDIQSIFRVYRFGQDKPVYVYRLLAQGTMEEKIYERQVTKQSLAQRVVDEHQIERHFNARDLQELYRFKPEMLNDPNRTERPTPVLPKDHMLAEMLQKVKDWIVTYHEHDSLLENLVSEELTEEERKAAWEEYEQEKKGIVNRAPQITQQFLAQHPGFVMGAQNQFPMMQQGQMPYPGRPAYGQVDVRPPDVMAIIQSVRRQFPNLTSEALQMQVQHLVRQQIAQQIMQQQELQRQQIEMRQRQEQERLRQIRAQIQQRQQNLDNTQRGDGIQLSSLLTNMPKSLLQQFPQHQQQPPHKN